MNREPFTTNEYYHIYNRGVDKRRVFMSQWDVDRFIKSMRFFNSLLPIGSLHEKEFITEPGAKPPRELVEIVAFCLNPNHFHMILKQISDNGIPEFMRRLSGGYTWHFNNRTERNGSLFQGRYKSKYIHDNDYLLRLSAYVNLNDRVHSLGGSTAKWVRSSWNEYIKNEPDICETSIVLDQFKNTKEYEAFALEALPQILERKASDKELAKLLME